MNNFTYPLNPASYPLSPDSIHSVTCDLPLSHPLSPTITQPQNLASRNQKSVTGPVAHAGGATHAYEVGACGWVSPA